MGVNSWNHMQFLHHKVRHIIRRGYLKKTYYDKKLMQARICTGVENENDRVDVLHPVGFLGRVKPSPKVEVFTMDVGADPSRRVVLSIIGDRKKHPKIEEGEAILYTPGDKKKFVRVYKKPTKDDGQGGDDDDKHESQEGIHTDADDLKITSTTKDTFSNKADKGIGHETGANFTVKAANATQMEAGQHVRKGQTIRDGEMFVQGNIHAIDHVAGGGATVSIPTTLADPQREDGSTNWNATGRPGNVSLLATAQSLASFIQQQTQKNQQTDAQIQNLMQRVAALEAAADTATQQDGEAGARLDDLEARVAALEGH